MTKLAALKANIEFGYHNDDLFNKVLIDRGITSTATYTINDRDDIDMCTIDVITYLLSHPDVKDGRSEIKFDKPSLRATILRLGSRYNLSTSTAISLGLGANISGEAVW